MVQANSSIQLQFGLVQKSLINMFYFCISHLQHVTIYRTVSMLTHFSIYVPSDVCVFVKHNIVLSKTQLGVLVTTAFVVKLMFIGPCIIVIIEEYKAKFMSIDILFHFLCAQHVSDINISIIRSLRLFF